MKAVLRFSIAYEEIEDGWFLATVREVPAAMSQGATRAEARENVIDALKLMLSPMPGDDAGADDAFEFPLAS